MMMEKPIDDGEMRRDWNDRARQDAKWFINCVRMAQSDDEFDETGMAHVRGFVANELPLLIGERNPRLLRVLEIGCGIGRMTRHLAGIFGEVFGTDVSDEMIRQGRVRLAELKNVRLLATNGVDIGELPADYFDFVFSAYVFQHIASKEIIVSNISDGYRVLKPGCVFKFLVSTVTNEEYLRTAKDTWSGASLFESEIRGLARQLGAQLVGVTDVGTQYCWTILRKARRVSATRGETPPEIVEIGRAEDLADNQVPLGGKGLGLLVAGLDRDRADANNVVVEVRDEQVQPFYVGPTMGWGAECLQVNFHLPEGFPAGEAQVRVRTPGEMLSGWRVVRILPAEPPAPSVLLVTNCVDGSVAVSARGSRSRIGLQVAGLGGANSVRVRIGCAIIEPESMTFVPSNGTWLVTAQLPEDVVTGEVELSVVTADRQSPVVKVFVED
ncbi:MAG: methyltransferase domain-containing protein [Acidobacteriota bacterium]